MLIPALIVVWALVLGISPGGALVGGAAVLMIVDLWQPDLLDRAWGRIPG